MTYEEVAARYDVRLCPSSDTPGCNATLADHRRGHPTNATIHWSPRRMNVRGLRAFLKLVATTRILRFA